MKPLRRQLVCLSLAALLVTPLIPIPSGDAQSVGTVWNVELTVEVESIFYNLAETITGEVEVMKDPETGALVLNGTGDGTWTYRHHEKEDQCPALSGDGTFEASFNGNVQPGFSGQSETVFVGLSAAPGDHWTGSGIGKYIRSESVSCRDEDTTWEEPRILAPVVIGPLGGTVKEWMEGIVQVQDHRGAGVNGAYVKVTGKIVPPDIEFRVYGTVKDSSGNSLFESKVAIVDFEDLQGGGTGYLDKLSALQPDYEETTTASESEAEYEFELDRPGDKLFTKFMVVSVLWYDGKPEFAVTNGKESGGRQIPVYQALCVDHFAEDCVKWEQTANGYEAKVDFVYGKKASHTDGFMAREDWERGAGSLDKMMGDAGTIYYNSYLGVKYLEDLNLGYTANPFLVKAHHMQDLCATNPNSAYYAAGKRGTGAPSFGGLGESFETVTATGAGVYICTGDSDSGETEAPVNREWHELGHYLLYELYAPRDGTSYKNHAGYKNDSTNDSFIEGFAEFFSMLTAEHYGDPRPYQYPVGDTWYNLEQDYKVWGDWIDEEFATAGILWDLHDGGVETNRGFVSGDGYVGTISRVYNSTVDKVAVDGGDIIKKLQSSRAKTLVGVYVALMSSVSSENLDMIFLNHGAFADISERNYIHDAWNETISQTGNTANRMARFSPAPELPGSYITSEDNALLEVAIKHAEPFGDYDYSYTLNLTTNKAAYFSMPPPYYPSQAVFSQLSKDGSVVAPNIATIESEEYWSYIDSGPAENATFKTIDVSGIVPVSSGNTTPPPEEENQPAPAQPSGCLIATAAFGSELTPQVQFLRNFRDNHILSTASGSSFMNAFNAWYYSFSPQVADYERQQPWLQQTVRIGIYPLLGVLQVAEKAYALVPGEFGSVFAGFVASSLIGAVYLSPVALLVKKVRRGRFSLGLFALVMTAVSVAVAVSILVNSPQALMVSTASFVIATVSISAALVARVASTTISRIRARP